MNNLVKPLQWEEISSTDCLWEAKFPSILGFYYNAYKFTDGKFGCSFPYNAWVQITTPYKEEFFSTLEEAKAACDKHYQEFVLSLLSPDVIRTLNIITVSNQNYFNP